LFNRFARPDAHEGRRRLEPPLRPGATSDTPALADALFMGQALRLARSRLGQVAPNPAVGCVIVRAGAVIAEGATAPGGRPHAEEIALEAAGEDARGATAYVSLEPCAVRSSGTDSCADLLVDAQVARVVAACPDPHPFADGEGLARLRAAGVAVSMGVGRFEAESINAGFFLVVREGRPLVGVDARAEGYDGVADFDPSGANLATELRRLAVEGLTRVRVPPGTALADALRAAGLVDLEPEA
jgi:diaminohydroxyphosphoribosylaminopyrimidine deaminase/5-amino-6-(5-phosphoribosylamino)uracil reductase